MAGFKTVFIKVRGRVIPLRKAASSVPDEVQKMAHKRLAMSHLRNKPTATNWMDRKMTAAFYKSSRNQSKTIGFKIAKRIARLKKWKSNKAV